MGSSTNSEIHKPGTDDGWHGVISKDGQFAPERLFCPFAHRANLVRYIAGLTEYINLSIIKPYPKGDEKGWPGWQFPESDDEYPGATVDHLFGSKYLHEIYFKVDPQYKGRYSVPLLWDKKLGTIVNNESAEMLRWLPTAFDSIKPPGKGPEINLYPNELASSIDKLTVWINRDLNTGVYKAGFAPNQEAYDEKVIPVFGALNKLDSTIAANGGPFVLGKHLTELDIRVYATIVRFDVVYVQHFKCNLGIIRHDYPYIETWLQHLYWNTPEEFGFQASTNFKHIKENYTKSHYDINPKAITPMGPYPDVPKTKYTDMTVGGVQMPEVIKYADSL